MRITVTGSAGFIGKHYVKKAKESHEVFEFDLVNGQDIARSSFFLPFCDAVVHLAATNGTRLFYQKPTEIILNDTQAISSVVLRYRNSNTKIVFASSCEIFNGAIDREIYLIPTDENVPAVFEDTTNPRWSYSIPKLFGENLVANCGNPWLIIRYFNVYGPGQKDHFVNEFVERVLKGEYYINGNDTRSFCYIDDAIEMTHALVGKHQNRIVNVGRHQETEIKRVAELILEIMGIDGARLEIRDSPRGSVTRRCPNTALVRELTGFEQYTSLRDGLEKTIESLI